MTEILNNEEVARKLTLRAEALSEFGRHEQAIALYLRALSETPEDDRIHCDISWEFSRMNDYDNAEKHSKFALNFNPSNYFAHSELAWINIIRGNKVQALNHAKTGISIAPESFTNVRTLALMEMYTKNYEKSLITAKYLIKLEPNESSSHQVLAGIYNVMKEYKTAVQCYRKALRLDPINTSSHMELGKCLAAINKPKEAAVHMLIAVKNDPIDQRYRLNLYRHVLGVLMKHPEHQQTEILAGFSPEVQKYYIKHKRSHRTLIQHAEIKDAAEVMEIYHKSENARSSISARFFNLILGLINKLVKHFIILIYSIFPIITIIHYFFY